MNAKEPLIKSKNYECRADKCSASANNSGGCATPKVEFWHPTILNQRFPNKVFIFSVAFTASSLVMADNVRSAIFFSTSVINQIRFVLLVNRNKKTFAFICVMHMDVRMPQAQDAHDCMEQLPKIGVLFLFPSIRPNYATTKH